MRGVVTLFEHPSPSSSVAIVEVQNYAQQHKVDIYYVSRDILDRLSQKRPHQVHKELALFQPPGFHCLVSQYYTVSDQKLEAEKVWGRGRLYPDWLV